MRYRVLPYRQGSRSAKALATALGGKVLKIDGHSTWRPTSSDVEINWGNTDPHESTLLIWNDDVRGTFLNYPTAIRQASNKLLFFQKMKEKYPDDIPAFWTSPQDIPDDAFPVVCRTVLSGHSGDGIVIAQNRDGLVPCSLYVKYIKKQDEYRIHIGKSPAEIVTGTDGDPFRLTVIAQQRKARRNDVENPNWQIRNHQNGFVYVRQDVHPPVSVVEAAKRALLATDLDFGAVDVIYNTKEGKAYVLEINTAPGLEGQTVQDYANFFKNQ